MKKELAQAKKQISKSFPMEAQIMERTESGYTFKNIERKFGLVKENRPIKTAVVNGFLQIIQGGKYKSSQSIIAIEATELLGKYSMTDFEGNIISNDEAKEYLIVLDGQHRTSAFAKLNLNREKNDQIMIPNVHIETGLQCVREYLADINMVGKSWNQADKVCVSAIGTGNQILAKINDLIKEGYSVSTASLICLGKRLSAKELNKILKDGDISNFPNEEDAIKRIDKFLTTAMAIEGMTIKVLRKRFYINGFNNFAVSRSDEDAFKALESLSINYFEGIKEDVEFTEQLKNAYDRLIKVA